MKRRHASTRLLQEVMDLILDDTTSSRSELRRRHRAHRLKGEWRGASECHVASAGDWLLVWKTESGLAVLPRTGTHEESVG
ncbi:type II toxin-antitoxin system mRNA interferase toxin, RelE/StbE family [Actinomyces sp. HMT897]|uniref:type II toxin-antitoxin system mRNA interferase toxin, RelE/StbE family n=1 Tax=Actinomyces sp. HMT897 TaxID=2789424 RepID=UPI001AEEBB83|nr:type II toxin-antitoxin system mRNA interferase toxin, RelE/StbE family [Actinomyces sp. HMT897]